MAESVFPPADQAVTADRRSVAWSVRQHSLFWLVLANSVGVLLAAELLWPVLGDLLAPLTYGRWTPLHLNWQLYGWCAVPLVGVLLIDIGGAPTRFSATIDRLALWAWTLALAGGGVSWLAGISSGKIFLDWHGWARPLLPAAMTVLWLALVLHYWSGRSRLSQGQVVFQGILLVLLFCVPPALFWASGRGVYPAVNPHSGGATGASLLGSTLGIIAVYGLLPKMLHQRPRAADFKTVRRSFWGMFVFSGIVFALIDHGHASSRGFGQQVGLGVLVVWIPLSWQYFGAFHWPASARRWLAAAFVWWVLLVVSGFIFFLPGISERLKFTNGLVAHAHLSLAGLVTCFNIALLNVLNPDRSIERGFWVWQGALALHIGVLAWIGWTEAGDPATLFLSRGFSQACYALRLGAGLVMWGVSIFWFLHRPRFHTGKHEGAPPASPFE